ncbi:MAG: radical SAM protein [Thermoplasmata archaeon]|nr:radical SAM protein [Euryarchaeota archaeon]RLF66226.1 MAG: radical SAM protein [Thermoplasmata archaeon]
MAFGPVPSRRLGRSLGVNNIPYKICSYSCVYCQVGKTLHMSIERRMFYDIKDILRDVKKKVKSILAKGEKIDYITFVPDGEPTLDINLRKEAELLKDLDIPIAIITNSSLMWDDDVRDDLEIFDLVSLKVDAVTKSLWKKINRPHKDLELDNILEGILEFSKVFRGKLITETMLIDGIDYSKEIIKIAKFLEKINPTKAYIAIPTRPPCEKWVKPANENIVNYAFQMFSESLGSDKVELLITHEGTDFVPIEGDVESELLSMTSVHPIREDSLDVFLKRAGVGWEVVERLLSEGKLVEIEYKGKKFYIRKFPVKP